MYNLKDPETLESIVQLVESSENQNRILKHTEDYQIINGNQRQHIINQMQVRFPKSWDKMIIINIKIGEKIIRKLSRVYSTNVKREVIEKDTGLVNENMTKIINYIYSCIDENGEDFNDILAKSNRYYTNHEYVELFTFEDEDGYIRLKALPQHIFTAIENKDKTKADVIVFKNTVTSITDIKSFIDWNLTPEELQNSKIIASYTVWSKDEHFTFIRLKTQQKSDKGVDQVVFKNVVTLNDNNPRGVNPYEVMPFTAIKRPTEGHFYPYGSEIAQMSKDLNVIISDLVTIASNQGFGQGVLYYDTEKPPAITESGPTNLILIHNPNGNSKFEFANANPDLTGHLSLAQSVVRLLLTTNDLTTDKVSGELNATQFASAIDRLIADSESIEFVETQRKKYTNVEQHLFYNILAILKYQVETQTLPEEYPQITLADFIKDYKLRVTFSSIKPMTTEKDKADTIKSLSDNGLILPWEKHLIYNENMTPEEAKQREVEIQLSKKEQIDLHLNNSLPKKEQTDLQLIDGMPEDKSMDNEDNTDGGETDSNNSSN